MTDLENASVVLKDAFDAYVAAIGESPDDSTLVIRAMNELHVAVRRFVDASVRASGWGNPFILPRDEEDENRHGGAVGVVQVEAHYRLKVTNEYTFRKFVIDRVRKTGNVPHEELDTPVSQIHELFAVDGWDPFRYGRPDLKVLQSRWSVSNDNP